LTPGRTHRTVRTQMVARAIASRNWKGYRHVVTVKAGVARDQFPEIINRAAYAKERTVVTRRDKEVAAVVPIEDLRLLQEIENHMDVEEALEALKEAREKGTISLESLKAELGL